MFFGFSVWVDWTARLETRKDSAVPQCFHPVDQHSQRVLSGVQCRESSMIHSAQVELDDAGTVVGYRLLAGQVVVSVSSYDGELRVDLGGS